MRFFGAGYEPKGPRRILTAGLARCSAGSWKIKAFPESRRIDLAEVSASRLFWLKITVLAAFCTGLLMSKPLWIGPRTYPLTPVSTMIPLIDGATALGLYTALLVLAALAAVMPRPQWWIAGFLAVVAAFCLADQTRWQPWVFQYSFLLVAMALYSWNSADTGGQKRSLNVARLIVAATYVFSGLQKINLNFIENDFPWLVQPITGAFPSTAHFLHRFGMVAPFLQVAFGVGLLTRRFRSVSLIMAVAMHLFILAMFGPAGLNWNDIVWPWTAAMAVFDILLFSGAHDFSWREIASNWRHPGYAAAILLFAILPAFSFVNLWDSYLSSALYSGNLTEAQIYLSDAGKASLPASIRSRLVHTSPDTNVLNLQRWAIEDLDVMPYPETRVDRAIAKSICHDLPDPAQLVLIVREQRMFFSKPEIGYRCVQL